MRLSLFSITLLVPACLALMQLTGCDYRTRYESCTYTSPPPEAQRIKSGDTEYLVFPASVSSDYTGCQKAWSPNGQLQASLKYTNGVVSTVELPDVEGEPRGCVFRRGELLEGDEASCLPYKRWRFSNK